MNINVDLSQVTCNNITLNQFLFLLFLHNNERTELSAYMTIFPKCFTKEDVDNMIEQGFLVSTEEGEQKYMLKNLNTTNKFHIFVPPKVDDWIDEWYNLWPQGIKSGGYYVKSDKTGCKNKLIRFMRNNPEFSKSIIIQATQNYIQEQELQGYRYMRMAPYFIEKNGMSVLAGYCEAIQQNYTDTTQESNFITEV